VKVIVDCSAVVYISSIGLRQLMLLDKQVRSAGGTTALVVRHPTLEEVLRIARFDLSSRSSARWTTP
jgi:anti-anti-sigma factor